MPGKKDRPLRVIGPWGRNRLEPFDVLADLLTGNVSLVRAAPFEGFKTSKGAVNINSFLIQELLKEGLAYREFYRSYIDLKRCMEDPAIPSQAKKIAEDWFVRCRDECQKLDIVYPAGSKHNG